MYSTPAKNILTKCADVEDFPTRFCVQMGLSVPSAGAANFDSKGVENENAASSFLLLVMVPEKENHLSWCVEAKELSRLTVLAHRK